MVQLTELEFHKLMRFTDAAASLEAQAQLLLEQAQTRINVARAVRDAYVEELTQKYPEFEKTKKYNPVEADFTLQPAE